ncbi:MAG: hypothetical protein ACRYF0_07635 [Janthinobacterium lividum]
MLDQEIHAALALALVRHYLPRLAAADGGLPLHWRLARALCAIAEQVLLVLHAPGGPLTALEQAELTAGVDELGRLLLQPEHSPATWPPVQGYLLQALPLLERLLVAVEEL